MIVKSDKSLVNCQISEEKILIAKMKEFRYKAAGATVAVGGITAGIGVSASSTVTVITALTTTAVLSVAPVLIIAGGLFTLGLGVWGGYALFKKGQQLH